MEGKDIIVVTPENIDIVVKESRPTSENDDSERRASENGSSQRPVSDTESEILRPSSENDVRKPVVTVERKPSLMLRSFFLGEPRPSPLPARARSQQQPISGEIEINPNQRSSANKSETNSYSSDEEDDVQSLNGGDDCIFCMFKNPNSNKKAGSKKGSMTSKNRAELQSTSIKNKNL